MLAKPNAFLTFSKLIIEVTYGTSVFLNIKVSSIGFDR